jgi:uncharacterized phage protein (TIGR02218 family)
MTYEALETSLQDATPIELYEFEYGPNRFLYTDLDTSYIYLSKEYLPLQISHTPFEESVELARNNITVTVPRDAPIADLFRIYPPSEEVSLTIYRIHRTDPDQEIKVVWIGRVLNASWKGVRADLHCENLFTSFKRKGLRRLYQKACPHVLYGPDCRAVKGDSLVTVPVSGVDGSTVTSPSLTVEPAGLFPGGLLEWEKLPDVWERRRIKDQLGDAIVLAQPVYDLIGGALIDLYPGCAHDKVDCVGKFANILNYGGFTDITKKNPFGSSGAF